MLEPKKILVGLAGQKAWHNCVGEAAPRISGKYLPSQLRTQNAGPVLAATSHGSAGAALLLKMFAEQRGLLLLSAAEKEIKQVFSRTYFRRQRHGANDGSNSKHAAQLALKG